MQHLITLVIETDETSKNPGRWNWSEVIDTPLPVTVVACTALPDEPTDTEVTLVHAVVQQSHDALASGHDYAPDGEYCRRCGHFNEKPHKFYSGCWACDQRGAS